MACVECTIVTSEGPYNLTYIPEATRTQVVSDALDYSAERLATGVTYAKAGFVDCQNKAERMANAIAQVAYALSNDYLISHEEENAMIYYLERRYTQWQDF